MIFYLTVYLLHKIILTYIIDHYNYFLASHITHIVCVNFICKCRDLLFKNFFNGRVIYSQSFCEKSGEMKSLNQYLFSLLVLMYCHQIGDPVATKKAFILISFQNSFIYSQSFCQKNYWEEVAKEIFFHISSRIQNSSNISKPLHDILQHWM